MTSAVKDLMQEFDRLARSQGLLPVKVTARYRKLVEEEQRVLGGNFGPLYRVAYPVPERLRLRAPGEVRDFVDDRRNMPPGLEYLVIRKYRDRVLFLITTKCAGHCMYCFRQDVLSDQDAHSPLHFEEKLDRVVAYLRKSPEIREVIFSGGDPINTPRDHLRLALDRIARETAVRNFRIHTRNVVYAPNLFTDELCELLASHRVRLVIHVVHPYELHGEAAQAIQKLRRFDVRCYSQFPILRGVNDHPVVLERLLTELDDLGVRPLSLFVPDPISYSAAYRVPLRRLFAIHSELNARSPAWVNSVRLVLDTPIGKVRREDVVEWRADNVVAFEREGRRVFYPDFPEELYQPGDLKVLLWKSGGE